MCDSTSGPIGFHLGGIAGASFAVAGTYTQRVVATSTAKFILEPFADTFVISSISIKEVDETTGNLTVGQNLSLGGRITLGEYTIDAKNTTYKGQLVITGPYVRVLGGIDSRWRHGCHRFV